MNLDVPLQEANCNWIMFEVYMALSLKPKKIAVFDEVRYCQSF